MIMTEDSSVDSITAEVKKHMPTAALHSVVGGEVTFKLPPDTSLFAPLVDSLSARKEELGVRHFGLSLTTMEQVFLGVSKVMDKEEEQPPEAFTPHEEEGQSHHLGDATVENGIFTDSRQCLSEEKWVKQTGSSLLLQRIKAFFIKRFIYTKRKWPLFITQVGYTGGSSSHSDGSFLQGLVPVVVTIACLLIDRNFNFFTEQEPPLSLTPSVFSTTTFSFVNADPGLENLTSHYKHLFGANHKVEETDNVITSLLQASEENLSKYREQHAFSASFLSKEKHTALKVWAQTVPYHTVGIGTSLVTNTLLRQAMNSSYSITTDNYPFPPNTMWQFTTEFSASSLIYPSMMSLALAFLSASYLVQMVVVPSP
ncbi:ATP-binding cassette sub-family A member 17 [Chionoecetes opilio]|uniref:ATP-binding cassette sub-family A member 17 n=1 Tax=Chionoecetes opilio TaxID=41210 RepID=A0A8J5CZN6_CHIOP|nr:ATP-binding cassette sub-family A member 17 [Chionoecetes opilio]